MNKYDLIRLISAGESDTVEFKARADLCPEQLAKEIVAMLNTKGGTILLGVNDAGNISGIQRENLEEWVMNVAANTIHPQTALHYEEFEIDPNTCESAGTASADALRVAVLTVPMGHFKPYTLRHKNSYEIFIRLGSTSRPATREQQLRLFQTSSLVYIEKLPVHQTSINDLDRVRIENYLRDIIEDPAPPATEEEWKRRLANLGFVNAESSECSIAGIVLFGKNPRSLLPHSGLRILAFEGRDKDYKAELDTVINAPLTARMDFSQGFQQVIDKGLVEQAVSAIDPFISIGAEDINADLRHEKQYVYPLQAIREVLINALVHRDWTRSVNIELSIYADRLEIVSPGALHNSMTIEAMIAGQRESRNPRLVNIMRDYKYSEAVGMGIRKKVIPAMRTFNGSDPVFEATDNYVKVTLLRK